MEIKQKDRGLFSRVKDYLFLTVLVPLVVITCHVVIVSIFQPDVIPDVLGYKIFMILDEEMNDGVEYGDLIFTKNTSPQEIKVGDVIAYRNNMNTVTIHTVTEIADCDRSNIQPDTCTKYYTLNLNEGETSSAQVIPDTKMEGLLTLRLSGVGMVVYKMQEPWVMGVISLIILTVGVIAYLIAKKMDIKASAEQGETSELVENSGQKSKKRVKKSLKKHYDNV